MIKNDLLFSIIMISVIDFFFKLWGVFNSKKNNNKKIQNGVGKKNVSIKKKYYENGLA